MKPKRLPAAAPMRRLHCFFYTWVQLQMTTSSPADDSISLQPRQYHVYLNLSIANHTGADCPNPVTSDSTTAIEYELPANTGLVLFLPVKYDQQVT